MHRLLTRSNIRGFVFFKAICDVFRLLTRVTLTQVRRSFSWSGTTSILHWFRAWSEFSQVASFGKKHIADVFWRLITWEDLFEMKRTRVMVICDMQLMVCHWMWVRTKKAAYRYKPKEFWLVVSLRLSDIMQYGHRLSYRVVSSRVFISVVFGNERTSKATHSVNQSIVRKHMFVSLHRNFVTSPSNRVEKSFWFFSLTARFNSFVNQCGRNAFLPRLSDTEQLSLTR